MPQGRWRRPNDGRRVVGQAIDPRKGLDGDVSGHASSWFLCTPGSSYVEGQFGRRLVVRDGLDGALGRTRTCDRQIRRLLLYPLSYEGVSPGYYADSARSAAEARCSWPHVVGSVTARRDSRRSEIRVETLWALSSGGLTFL